MFISRPATFLASSSWLLCLPGSFWHKLCERSKLPRELREQKWPIKLSPPQFQSHKALGPLFLCRPSVNNLFSSTFAQRGFAATQAELNSQITVCCFDNLISVSARTHTHTVAVAQTASESAKLIKKRFPIGWCWRLSVRLRGATFARRKRERMAFEPESENGPDRNWRCKSDQTLLWQKPQ